MTVIATESNRFSTVVKHEYAPSLGICRDAVIVNDSAQTLKVGTALGRTLVGGAATAAAAASNTGNGTSGSVTVNPTAKVGIYTVKFTAATAFVVLSPEGRVQGTGATGTAYAGVDIGFTITAGGTAFVAGDVFFITVTGTEKFKVAKATATDGSNKVAAIYIGDPLGVSYDYALPATTDTTLLVLSRGPAIVAKANLVLDASFSTAAQKNQAYADLKAVGIYAETTV